MSHAAAFLQDIREHPHDDAPRLIFSDWLEEQGDPRGRFLRTQCQLARMDDADRRRRRLEQREERLLQRYQETWLSILRRPGLQPRFWRGFLDEAWPSGQVFWLGIDDFLDHPERWWCAALLPEVGVCNHAPLDGQLERLADSPFLRLVSALRFEGAGVTSQGLKALAAAPHAVSLRTLSLSGTQFGASAISALTAARALRSLTSLVLSGNHLGNLGAEALARCDAWPGLCSLDLSRNEIGDSGIRALAASRHLAGLTDLNVRSNPFSDEGARALAGSPYLGRVKTLRLRGIGQGRRCREILTARFGPTVHL
jgi:uncharacterized protein (TIGR02996 family)